MVASPPSAVRPPLIVIAGPTASGKSSLAMAVAERFDAEIVSADSMQVYRGMDIGTAKPTAAEQEQVPHHLIDLVDPSEPYDAAQFVNDADRVIDELSRADRTVFVVGGTGLYIRALLHGLQAGPKPSPELRSALLEEAERTGWPALHERLKRVDPQMAVRLHPHDKARILRALEVVQTSGVSMAEWQGQHGFSQWRYRALILGVERPRDRLNQRINARVDLMMTAGFAKEVEGLLADGVPADTKSMQALGYRRLCQFHMGQLGLEEAVTAIKTDTRRFAKRQMTWFRREPGLTWTPPDPVATADQIQSFLSQIRGQPNAEGGRGE